MGVLDYIWLGILAVFQGPEVFAVLGVPVSITLVMVLGGFLMGIAVGATPGLAGPFAIAIANLFNWTIGGVFLRSLGVLSRVPTTLMLPLVFLITLTAVYAQDGGLVAICVVMIFGVLGYILRKLEISILPFVIGFLLSKRLEELIRGGYSESGGDPLFLLKSPIAVGFLLLAILIIVFASRSAKRS